VLVARSYRNDQTDYGTYQITDIGKREQKV